MNFYDPRHTPDTSGTLHQWDNETANCGMGAIANLNGEKSYEIIDRALTSVCNMTHRGAVDADMKTGDGSGILCQIPRPLFVKAAAQFGFSGEAEDLGVGVFFLPEGVAANIRSFTESVLTRRQIPFLGWREVPVNPDELGELARLTQPVINHLLISRPAEVDADHFERLLYLVRREIEREFKSEAAFYIPTLSSRLISYKGLAMPATLRAFYSDLQDSDFQTGISLYHQRFSTNTFPAWPLGQPFRMMYNGEINTVRGNRNWMALMRNSSNPTFGAMTLSSSNTSWMTASPTPPRSTTPSNYSSSPAAESSTPCVCLCLPPLSTTRRFPKVHAFYNYIRSFSNPGRPRRPLLHRWTQTLRQP